MDKEIGRLKNQLILTSDIKLSEYAINPSILFGKRKYNFELLKRSRNIHPKNESYFWLFSGRSLGDYCRSLNSSTTDILNKVSYFIRHCDYSLDEMRNAVIAPLLNDINILLDKGEEHKANLENNSIIINITPSFDQSFSKNVLIESINRLYDYRQSKLIKLCDELKIVIDNRTKYFSKIMPGDILGTIGFCWNKKRNIFEDLVKFHTLLRELNFIEKDTSIDLLKKAFGCTYIKEPLNIKWSKPVKGKSSKALLFHLIDELEHFNYVEITEQNSILFNKIEHIFCDINGERFHNLDISKSQWLNQRKKGRTPQEIQLDNILYSVYYS